MEQALPACQARDMGCGQARTLDAAGSVRRLEHSMCFRYNDAQVARSTPPRHHLSHKRMVLEPEYTWTQLPQHREGCSCSTRPC